MRNPGSRMALAVCLAFTLCAFYGSASSQTKDEAQSGKQASKSEHVTDKSKTRGAGNDENIKSNNEKNSPNAKVAPPPNKGGSRGAGPYACGVHIDNRTPWFVRVYVDGGYVGTVNRYGDLAGITGNGPTQVYAVALFDDGTQRYWGPRVFPCGAGGSYTWTIS